MEFEFKARSVASHTLNTRSACRETHPGQKSVCGHHSITGSGRMRNAMTTDPVNVAHILPEIRIAHFHIGSCGFVCNSKATKFDICKLNNKIRDEKRRQQTYMNSNDSGSESKTEREMYKRSDLIFGPSNGARIV